MKNGNVKAVIQTREPKEGGLNLVAMELWHAFCFLLCALSILVGHQDGIVV